MTYPKVSAEVVEARRVWVEALESGEYEQGTRCLRSGDEFCCLGVLSPEDLDTRTLIGRASLSSLDFHNAGRYMPPRFVGIGSGTHRRFTITEAAITWACTDLGATGGGTGRGLVSAAALAIADHLYGCDRLPAYAAWTARGRYVFTDDVTEVARVCTEHGWGRVALVHFYVERVRSWLDHRTEGTASASDRAVPDASSYPRSVVPSVGWSGPTERQSPVAGVTPPSGGPGQPPVVGGA